MPDPDHDPTSPFADHRGFFRVRPASRRGREPLAGFEVGEGPPWDEEQARAKVREFLDLLTEGRTTEEHPDPLEYAHHNGLLLLFGPEEQRRFEELYPRLPVEMADAWRHFLAGGRAVDAFGPANERETVDERRVDRALVGARRRRRSLIVLGLVGLAALVGASSVAVASRDSEEGGVGTIRFGAVGRDSGSDDPATSGPPPSVERDLLIRLDRPVAVRRGEGEPASRIDVDPPGEVVPVQPGEVAATLFRYGDAGQAVLVGPDGWLDEVCIQVSTVSEGLRPFDTVRHEVPDGACAPGVVGGEAAVTCRGEDTVMLRLVLPEGEVPLVEGGSATVSGVRIAVHGEHPDYERVSVNGLIEVPEGSEVAVPTFGGEAGSTVNFDVSERTGAPMTGSCVLG